MPYLLDSDVLAAASRIHYHPDFCQLFWDWIDVGHSHGEFFSIDKVHGELKAGDDKDPLSQWCQRPTLSDFFLPTRTATAKWRDLANWASTRSPIYLPAAQSKFLSVNSADAWLIAFAAANAGWTIVTNEVAAPASRRDIKLPDAAQAQGVKTMSMSTLLRTHAKANFTFKK